MEYESEIVVSEIFKIFLGKDHLKISDNLNETVIIPYPSILGIKIDISSKLYFWMRPSINFLIKQDGSVLQNDVPRSDKPFIVLPFSRCDIATAQTLVDAVNRKITTDRSELTCTK